ncbi:MAG: ParB/RepB/Spo0J family partition protein [Ignavibacteriales bacterium]|nr:ParB/RepB/Spo0J family partition protein [Ignavibacteriales bacterium]
MKKSKQGLGRGLDALIKPYDENKIDIPIEQIPYEKIEEDDGTSIDILIQLDVEKILPNPFQPRTDFRSEALDELKKSILENGLIQPITVRRAGKNNYELISGERRFRACKEIGYTKIPAYIRKVDTNEAMLALSIIENVQREDLNPIEIALGYKRLIDDCNLSQEDIAERVSKDRTTITNFLRLLKLPKSIQQNIINDEIAMGHARALINLPNKNIQLQIVQKIIKQQLSVRDVEKLVRRFSVTDNIKEEKKGEQKTSNPAKDDLQNKLRLIFGTKVICNQKKEGAGEIIIQFYSNEELERLLELFNIIEKNS